VDEEAAAHSDAAMDAPDGQRKAGLLEPVAPGEPMLIDAVDQRAVEIEEKRGGAEEMGNTLIPVSRGSREEERRV